MSPRSVGLLLVAAGLLLVVIGFLVSVGGLAWFGRLPGDIRVEGEHGRLLVPLASMAVVSVVLTLLVNLLRRLW